MHRYTRLLTILLGLAALPLTAQTGSVYPLYDAVLDSQFPDSVIDQSAVNGNLLAFREYADGEATSRVQSLVSFSLAGFGGRQVASANFTFRGKVNEEAFANDFVLELFNARDPYDPETVTAGDAPRRGNRLGSVPLTTDSGRQPFVNQDQRLVDYLNGEILAGATEVHFYLRSGGADSTSSMFIGGADNGTFAPILEYTSSPEVAKYSIADAVTNSAFPDSVIDQAAINNNLLAFREYDAAGEAEFRTQSFVLFDISDLQGQQVEAADFSFRGKVNEEAFANGFELELRSLRDPFARPDSTTASNQPRSRRTLGTVALTTSSARQSFVNNGTELIDYLNTASLSGATEIGFLIRSTGADSTASMFIGGTENGSFGPILNYRLSPATSKYSTADAVTNSAFPDSVIDQAAINNNLLAFREYDAAGAAEFRTQSFLKFDISELRGRKVSAADFSIRGKVNEEAFADDFQLELRSLRDPFARPDSTTANNQPRSRRTLGTLALNTSSDRRSFVNSGTELVDYINTASLSGATEIGFLIRSTGADSTASMFIGGTENGSFGPILNYEVAPEVCTYGFGDGVVLEQFPDSIVDRAAINNNLLAFRTYDTATFRAQSYVKFDLAGLAGQQVATVDLSIRGKVNEEAFADDFGLELRGLREDFGPDTLTWNTRPRQGSLLARTPLNTSSDRRSFISDGTRLVDYVNEQLRNGETTIGFQIRSSGADSTNSMFIGGINNGSFGPILTVGEQSIFTTPNDTAAIIDDTYVVESTPDSNYNGVTAMQVAVDTTNDNNREVYLKFPLGDNRTNVVSTILKVRASQENSGTLLDDFEIQIFGVDDDNWGEDSLTWNNRPPSSTEALFTFNVQASGNYDWTSPELTQYVRDAIAAGRTEVSFAVKGVANTPGSNVWISDRGFVPARLVFDYRRVAAEPIFLTPNDENYVPSVAVELTSQTPGAVIYYTLDGSTPTDASTEYVDPIVLTDTTTVTAIAYADGFAPSGTVSRAYDVAPIGVPVFTPTPLVEYTDALTVTLEVAPADAILLFTTSTGDPITPYPDGGILITETTTIRAQGISADGLTTGPVVEATYNIVATVAGTGTGPGGVGASDNTISGQPENALWLAASSLTDANDGDVISLWEDASGNDNDAVNTFVEGGSNNIPNTAEAEKPAPTFIASGPNGRPVLQFGTADGSEEPNRSLVVPDADNLDGGAGLSLFVVMKRNELFADFAGIVQKRDTRGGAATQSYILEMNGGANPNKMQFVLERQTFINSTSEFNADDYYIINTEIQGDFGQGIFRNNGTVEGLVNNNLIVPATDAPMIIGGFQPLNIAEVIVYKKGLNAPQNRIVHNYLATKYGLTIGDASLFSDASFTYDLIGIGMDTYLETGTEQEHRSASGGGLRIDARTGLAVGSYVLAAHRNRATFTDGVWDRVYQLETTGTAPNVTLSFDFAAVGLDVPTDAAEHKLWYRADGDADWTDLGLTGTLQDGNRLAFDADAPATGQYTISVDNPATSVRYVDNSADLKLFPVPVSDRLTVTLENEFAGQVDLALFDQLGRQLATLRTQKAGTLLQTDIDVQQLPAGTYTLRVVQNGRFRSVRRFSKQ